MLDCLGVSTIILVTVVADIRMYQPESSFCLKTWKRIVQNLNALPLFSTKESVLFLKS